MLQADCAIEGLCAAPGRNKKCKRLCYAYMLTTACASGVQAPCLTSMINRIRFGRPDMSGYTVTSECITITAPIAHESTLTRAQNASEASCLLVCVPVRPHVS